MGSRLGGDATQLAAPDILSRAGVMGNPYGPKGGFADSPLAGSMVGAGQLNQITVVRNDMVDPLNVAPTQADVLIRTTSAPNIVVTSIAVEALNGGDGAPGGGVGGVGGTGPGGNGGPGGGSGSGSGTGDGSGSGAGPAGTGAGGASGAGGGGGVGTGPGD